LYKEIGAVPPGREGMLQAAFYEPGTLDPQRGLDLKTDQACLILVTHEDEETFITAANPCNDPLTLNVTLGGHNALRFELPSGADAGRSVRLSLTSESL